MPEEIPPIDSSVNVLLLWRSAVEIASNTLALALLEARLAGKSLAAILGYLLILALLIMVVWLFSMAALAAWLIFLGINAAVALVSIAALNLLCICLVLAIGKKMQRNLTFSATRRQLRGFSGKAHDPANH